MQESEDFRAEADELYAFLGTLDDAVWLRPTAFKGWTAWDVVAHLHMTDRFALAAVGGAEPFREASKHFGERSAGGSSQQQIAREHFSGVAAPALRERWRETCHQLCDALGLLDPLARVPWFGPDMGARMFATARLMETWAHGQAVYDLVGRERAPTDRLRSIATIGVKTFAWSFVNRQQAVPGDPPYVRLEAPSGAIWEWNEPSEVSAVRGTALGFCQVVTQTRNAADTSLEAVGSVAASWLAIAQCFAGGAEDPPPPGLRVA